MMKQYLVTYSNGWYCNVWGTFEDVYEAFSTAQSIVSVNS